MHCAREGQPQTAQVTSNVYPVGQGLYPSRATILGASSVDEQVLKQFQNSRAWRTAYRVAPRTACSAAIGGPRGNATANLCATSAAGEHSQQFLTELLMATSPAVYSTFSTFADDLHRSLWRNDGDLDEPEVGDQGPCDTCVGEHIHKPVLHLEWHTTVAYVTDWLSAGLC